MDSGVRLNMHAGFSSSLSQSYEYHRQVLHNLLTATIGFPSDS